MKLEQLLQHLQIEQETRWLDNNSLKEPFMKAHMVEEKSKKKKPENKKFSKAKKTTNFKYNGSILNLVNAIIVTKLVTMRVIVEFSKPKRRKKK